MNAQRWLDPPVIAFAVSVGIGWGISIYLSEWRWRAIGLALGFVAGDLVEAFMPKPAQPNSKHKGTKQEE